MINIINDNGTSNYETRREEQEQEDLLIMAEECRKEYQREWRRKNADKVRENRQRYWVNKAMAMLTPEERITVTTSELQEMANALRREYLKRWREENPDLVKEAKQRYWIKKALEKAGEMPGACNA